MINLFLILILNLIVLIYWYRFDRNWIKQTNKQTNTDFYFFKLHMLCHASNSDKWWNVTKYSYSNTPLHRHSLVLTRASWHAHVGRWEARKMQESRTCRGSRSWLRTVEAAVEVPSSERKEASRGEEPRKVPVFSSKTPEKCSLFFLRAEEVSEGSRSEL